LPIPIVSSVFPAFSCTKLKVLGLILKSLMHFELILVQGDQQGSSFSFLQATFVEEVVFSTLYVFGAFVKNKMGITMYIH
jgi:hypothetical protein